MKGDTIVGGVIVAVLQGSRTTTSKVTVLVALAVPPNEFAIVLVNVTGYVATLDFSTLTISICEGLFGLTVIGAPDGIVQV